MLPNNPDFIEFLNATIEAAEFADCGPDHETYNKQFAPETLERIKADCFSFWCRMYFYISAEKNNMTPAQAGHDFWLTRQGHGAGFWDGDWEIYGGLLTELSKKYGTLELHLGDDNLIYA